MRKLNVEFKARVDDLGIVREALMELNPLLVGTDHQRDTYFAVPNGRLKLREGNIENSLIFYERSNEAGTRESRVELAELPPDSGVGSVLRAALPVRSVVEKTREIYFVGDTKIHLDFVPGHGCFLEVEAPTAPEAEFFMGFFGVSRSRLEGRSYSDFAAVSG